MVQPSPWMQLRVKAAQQRLMKLLAEQDAELRRLCLNAAREANRIVASSVGSDTISAQIRALQYEQAQSAINQMAKELWDDIPSTISQNVLTGSQMAANESKALTRLLGVNASKGRVALLQYSMQNSAYRGWDNVASRIANGIDLSASVYRGEAYTTGKIGDVVNRGIQLGKSAAEIASDVSGFINPQTPGGVRYAAQRLGRTELNNAYHETSRQTYNEAPFVEAVQWSLSGSHPRSDECDSNAHENNFKMGEGVYPTDQVPDKPHPNCFCFILPITPDPDEFLRRLKRGDYDCG